MQRRFLALRRVSAAMAMVTVVASCDAGFDRAADSPARQESVGFAAPGRDAAVPAPLPPFSDGKRGSVEHATPAAGTASAASEAQAVLGQSGGIGLPAQTQQPGSMLIRSGHATIEVDSVDVGIARVRRLARETGALIANTTVQTGREERRSASLELRVPSDRFDAVVNGLTPIGKVESVNITAQDVGEEFVDLTARLANARRLEARLIELLANRTGRLSDVLAVERELARVREQIERYEGRLRYLQSRVSVSSLTVVVHEPPPVVATRPGENIIGEAFVEAWRRFVRLTAGFIASLGVLIPLGALGAAAFVLGRRYLPRREPASEHA
jgi:acetolactate synthase regulatory subunit